nr:MAG TPA: ribose-phosphate pyrophosphokinase [Crassvirales sp.]
MNLINLINREAPGVPYTLTTFPDGEPHIVLGEINRKYPAHVVCRIANPNDLFVLLQVGNILNRQGVPFSLTIRYLMSARMDRVMSFNEAFSLEIVANAINSIHPTKVYVYEPHSERSTALINNSIPSLSPPWTKDGEVVCFPDGGAAERYKNLYKDNPKIVCDKTRDPQTGELRGFTIKREWGDYDFKKTDKIVVVDDLCDRGGTFMGIAKLLRKKYPQATLDINVVHMVNSEGIRNLSKTYDHVTFTNSYKDWREEMKLPKNCHMIVF